MQTRFDQLAKAMLAALLQRAAHVESGREIPGHIQIADLWVTPDQRRSRELARLGMLGRMVERGPCLIEPFSRVPQARDIRGCILEQYGLDNAQARDARRDGQAEPPFPGLWIISTGSPDSLIKSMELRPMGDDWPSGFLCGRAFDRFYLVILRMLPVTPDTLFLRLLGRDATFTQALRELRSQSGDEPGEARSLLEPVLVAFRREFPQDLMEEEDMEALRHLEAVYADIKREHVQEGMELGKEQGLEQGLEQGIEALCEVLQIELTEQRREELASADAERLEQVLAQLRTTRRWPG
jgi:hypothetical protein